MEQRLPLLRAGAGSGAGGSGQDAGVENSAVHATSVSDCGARSVLVSCLGKCFGNLVVTEAFELGGALGDELVATSAKLLAVGQHVGEAEPASNSARHVSAKLAVLDKAYDSRTTQTEDLGSLLGRKLLVAGQDADRLAVAQGLHHSLEDFVELLGQLDPVVLACARQEEGRLNGTVTRLVCLDETENLGEFIGFGGDRAGDFGGGGAHDSRPFLTPARHLSTVTKVAKCGGVTDGTDSGQADGA